jgi:hypothetical protein
MATISTAERNTIIDLLFTVSETDYVRAAAILDLLQTGIPAIPWATIMRTRAALWAPYASTGLGVTQWCDNVVRIADLYAASRV